MTWKGAIFDLDGTLLDSMWVWPEIDVEFLARRGIPIPEDYTRTITPMGFRATAEYTVRRFGLRERPEDIIEEWNEMAAEAYETQVELKPGAWEYLRALAGRGVKLGIATGSHQALFIPALKRSGVYDLFHSYTTIGEVSRGKGFPDVYLREAEKLGLEAGDCAVFEDILLGVRGAQAGGFYTLAVEDPWSAHEREAIRAAAQQYVESYYDLL